MRPALLLVALFLGTSPALGQRLSDDYTIEPGALIRIQGLLPGGSEVVNARVVSVGPTFIGFSPLAQPDLVLNREYVTLGVFDVRHRSRSGSTRSGAAWGAYLGAAIGLIAGPFVATSAPIGTGTSSVVFGTGGAVVGLGIGAYVGRVLAPPRWHRYAFE
jgi:hypothetical protein